MDFLGDAPGVRVKFQGDWYMTCFCCWLRVGRPVRSSPEINPPDGFFLPPICRILQYVVLIDWDVSLLALPLGLFPLGCAFEANSSLRAAAQGVTHATSLIQVRTSKIFLTSQKRGFAIPSCEVPWLEAAGRLNGIDISSFRAFGRRGCPNKIKQA